MIDLKTLLNPYMILGALLWSLAVLMAGYMTGSEKATERAEAVAAVRQALALQRQIEADAELLRIEKGLRERDRLAYNRFYEESHAAKQNADRLIADLRAGIVRLRVPTVPRSCPAPENAGGPAADRPESEGHAELAPDAAIFLASLLARGDDAIRKHAEVVDRYERLRLACMSEARP